MLFQMHDNIRSVFCSSISAHSFSIHQKVWSHYALDTHFNEKQINTMRRPRPYTIL